jgi:hypothetical protein
VLPTYTQLKQKGLRPHQYQWSDGNMGYGMQQAARIFGNSTRGVFIALGRHDYLLHTV